MTKKSRKVFVDADSCPVKQEIVAITAENDVEAVFVASYAHMSEHADQKWVFVDCEREEVDLYLMNNVSRNDIVITQDHALASILVPRGSIVISPRGKQYLEKDMLGLLHSRHMSQKQRRAGGKTKGPTKFTEADRQSFCNTLKKNLIKKEGIL
ncbi:DUF188 domain-containing protein [Anaerobacillus sp. MEB173]|uniref:YaiI/YqxD family protein n=1 Tax=Anaerobacillus sp. MEB173 TaxID=3383345 RepID=UPI003F8E744C